jgi:hypothetical protein
MRHTPGPWYVGAMNDALFIIDAPPRPSNDDINPNQNVRVIAKVNEDLGHSAVDAYSHLIAAAPQLLEALFNLRNFMWSEGYADQTAEMAQADAAIEKAGGAE